ncbi:MAG: serine/threonine-protein kinase, partial [Gemmatimonadota bacterium]
LRRFRSETRILARLEHPNIARLYDAGVEDGQPYLVMEYVRGERIDRYCDARGLGIAERLELFLRVCEAVQHAHQNLVVHRDLKPSNILVSSDGQVKLLDFGISKLVDDDAAHAAGVTGTGLRAMTVEYSSPEQVRGDPVTTASDVYALGVVFYELLTGRRPYPVGPGPLDTLRAVLETDAGRPSASTTRSDATPATAGSAEPATPADLARARSSTPEQLARRLRGDLDTIVLEALQKEPTRRYPSAQLLLDDIRRHLEGRPVRARPDTAGYRLGKFARRNWVSLTATAAVIVAMLAGLTIAVWQARVASAQRDVAQVEARKANRITDFLIGVFEVADPSVARADTVTAVQILDRGAARIDAELSAEPVVQATMMDVIGRVYASLSLYDRADSLLTEALRRRTALLGPDHPDVAASVFSLARLAFLRNRPEADSLLGDAVAQLRAALGPDDPRVAEALVQLAFSHIGSADSTAELALDEARRIYAAAPGDHEADLASITYALGYIRHDQGRYPEAESLYRAALAVQRDRLGPNHPNTLTTTSNLGFLLQLLGRFEAADSALQAVLSARRRIFGERHARVATSLLVLAELRYAQGAWQEAERYVRDARAMREELFGPDSPPTLYASFYLARVLQAEGQLDQAESLYRQVLRAAETRGTANSTVARTVNGFAGVLEARGDTVGAETFYRRALELYRNSVGETHPFTAIVRGNVAALLIDQGQLDAAEPMLRTSIETLRAAWTDEHETVGVLRLQLGTLLMLRGELPEAEAMMREARRVIEKALPPDHWRVAQARLRLGSCLVDMGRLDEAGLLFQSAFEILEPQRRVRFGDWRQLLTELFELNNALGRPDRARRYQELFRESVAVGPNG